MGKGYKIQQAYGTKPWFSSELIEFSKLPAQVKGKQKEGKGRQGREGQGNIKSKRKEEKKKENLILC